MADEDQATTETSSSVADALRAALRRMPGPVALVTTTDPHDGAPAGLAASAVIPVSMEPPSLLVAINRSASAHAAILRAGRYCVNLLHASQTEQVGLFSNAALREQRFADAGWRYRRGLPYREDACSSIICAVTTSMQFGTHELFIGEVEDVLLSSADGIDPLIWVEGGFASITRTPGLIR